MPRFQPFTLHGPPAMRVASLALFAYASVAVAVRRLMRGPRLPSWSLEFEVATRFFQLQDARVLRHAKTCSKAGDIAACRQIADSLVFRLPALARVRIERETRHDGTWFIADQSGPTVLYFHGGGYAFYPAMTDNIIAAIAEAVGGRVFVPHYPLAPEHPFPAALGAAQRAFRWMLDDGLPASQLILAGDSAGGHLALVLLMTHVASGLPKPAAAIAISPWTDPQNRGASMRDNADFDWMSQAMSAQLASWAGEGFLRSDPLRWADDLVWSDLPPLLIHAGDAEICRDMIGEFCAHAAVAGADITLRSFADMNHNFHGFGDLVPQSRAALADIAAFVARHTGRGQAGPHASS